MIMHDLTQTADNLSLHSDRWLFLFALVVLALSMLAVARYFVRQYERLQTEHQEVLAAIMGKQAENQIELVRVVATNTEALRAVATEIRTCKERNLAARLGHDDTARG